MKHGQHLQVCVRLDRALHYLNVKHLYNSYLTSNLIPSINRFRQTDCHTCSMGQDHHVFGICFLYTLIRFGHEVKPDPIWKKRGKVAYFSIHFYVLKIIDVATFLAVQSSPLCSLRKYHIGHSVILKFALSGWGIGVVLSLPVSTILTYLW